MSIPNRKGKKISETRSFINKQFIRPFASVTPVQRFKATQALQNLPVAGPLDPRLASGSGRPHDPDRWTPLNVLGEGGYGIASLWQYRGPGDNDDPASGNYLDTYVVLKTGRPGRGENAMKKEGRIMNLMSRKKPNEEHVVNLIYIDSDLTKLYLEFCSGGDLDQELRRKNRTEEFMKEGDVWRLLLCLAKGLCAMSSYDIANQNSIIHFDLKPANVLIEPDPVRHRCMGSETLFKIGDFGLGEISSSTKQPVAGSIAHARAFGTRGTPSYFSPEVFFWDLVQYGNQIARDKDIGVRNIQEWERLYGYTPKLDIWAVGAMVWQVMTLELEPPTGDCNVRLRGEVDYHYFAKPNNLQPLGGWTFGKEILENDGGYSQDLIHVVQWCLMAFPNRRCSAEELRALAQEKVDLINSNPSLAPDEAAFPINQEPNSVSLGDQMNARRQKPGPPKNVYMQRLEVLLQSQGRTMAFYDRQRADLEDEERRRVITRFMFKEQHSPEFLTYLQGGQNIWNQGRDQDLAVMYQLAFEESPTEIRRALVAYARRTDITYSAATRRQIVVRQLEYESTPTYYDYLLFEFNRRYAGLRPEFMKGSTSSDKIRVQRVFEDQQEPPIRPFAQRVLNSGQRRDIIDNMNERLDDPEASDDPFERFIEEMEQEGRNRSSEASSAMVRLNFAWEEQADEDEEMEDEDLDDEGFSFDIDPLDPLAAARYR